MVSLLFSLCMAIFHQLQVTTGKFCVLKESLPLVPTCRVWQFDAQTVFIYKGDLHPGTTDI